MMPASAAKLRRLNQFRRAVPHVSASALAAILGKAHDNGVPEMFRRPALKHATDLALNGDTPYVKLLKLIDVDLEAGGSDKLLVVCPLAMLWVVVAEGGSGLRLMTDAPTRMKHHGASSYTQTK